MAMLVGRRAARLAATALLVAHAGCRDDVVSGDDEDMGGETDAADDGDDAPDHDDDDDEDDEADSGDSGGAADDPPRVGSDFEPPPPAMRRLLAREYRSAVSDLLGAGIGDSLAVPDDYPISGQAAVGASQVVTGDLAITRYEEAAIDAVNAFFSSADDIDGVVGCVPTSDEDEACALQFIRSFGRRAFRRPLHDEEAQIYLDLFRDGRDELDGFYGGVFLVLAGMLQSPNFLYLVEIGEPDPEPDVPGLRALTEYELAAKMSFFLLGTTPSDALLDAAENGALAESEGIREVARDMLAAPRAQVALDAYFIELFGLDALDDVIKVPSAFPDLESDIDQPSSLIPEFGEATREETLALVRHLVWEEDADFLRILTVRYTFMNPLLESLYYGAVISGNEDPEVFLQAEPPDEQGRAGILGHIGLLSLNARTTRTSPTLRGKFMRDVILCDPIPPPPDDVEFDLPDDTEAPTLREKLLIHQESPACAPCHIALDNLGFALEHYDGLGFHRTLDNGYPIDASAELEPLGAFDGARELGDALRASPDVPHCLVKKLVRHAVGHVETEGELEALDDLVDGFVDDDQRLAALLEAIVLSPAFRHVGPEDADR